MNLAGIILVDPHTHELLVSPSVVKFLASLTHDGHISIQYFSRRGEPAHRHGFTVRPDNAVKKLMQELTESHNQFMNFTMEVKTNAVNPE